MAPRPMLVGFFLFLFLALKVSAIGTPAAA
jgi:hypothetical protein